MTLNNPSSRLDPLPLKNDPDYRDSCNEIHLVDRLRPATPGLQSKDSSVRIWTQGSPLPHSLPCLSKLHHSEEDDRRPADWLDNYSDTAPGFQ